MAAHVAAMAPATNIGAAHPVAVGGGSGDKEMIKKIENDAAAFARTIATERGRNAEWAEKAVRSSVSATEREAVKLKIVDLVAESVPDLLAKIDGPDREDRAGPVTLATKDAPVKKIEVRFRDRFLALISDPEHRLHPDDGGHARDLLRAVQPGRDPARRHGRHQPDPGLLRLPEPAMNWAGLLLILFGVALLIAEIKVVSHGVLTIGGVIAMLLGSMMLFDAPEATGSASPGS